MKLEQPRRQTARVYELARELGWTSRQLLNELQRRGEFVKSATSVLEPPVVRAIRQEFATGVGVSNLEADVSAAVYGRSAEPSVAGRDDGFASALAEARNDQTRGVTIGFRSGSRQFYPCCSKTLPGSSGNTRVSSPKSSRSDSTSNVWRRCALGEKNCAAHSPLLPSPSNRSPRLNVPNSSVP